MKLRLPTMCASMAGVILPLFAHAETLNVKLGLWEVTSVTETRGVPPLPKALLDKLTPEQRRKMEADIRAEQAQGPERETDRECITQKDLEQPFASSNAKECKQTKVTTTRTAQELRIVCTGPVPGSGTLKVSAPTPEKMVGSLDLKLGEGTDAMTIKSQLQGRWLSSECGEEADDEDSGDDAAEDDA